MASEGSAESDRETGNKRHFAATKRVFWALSASKMHLRSGPHPELRCRSLQLAATSPRTPFLLLVFSLKFHDFHLSPWVLWATKDAAKCSTSKKRWKNTELHQQTVIYWLSALLYIATATHRGIRPHGEGGSRLYTRLQLAPKIDKLLVVPDFNRRIDVGESAGQLLPRFLFALRRLTCPKQILAGQDFLQQIRTVKKITRTLLAVKMADMQNTQAGMIYHTGMSCHTDKTRV